MGIRKRILYGSAVLEGFLAHVSSWVHVLFECHCGRLTRFVDILKKEAEPSHEVLGQRRDSLVHREVESG